MDPHINPFEVLFEHQTLYYHTQNYLSTIHTRHHAKSKFKKTLRKLLFDILNSENAYINRPTLIKHRHV